MRSFLLTTLFLCIASFGFAQKQNVYFVKNDGSYVETRDSADYLRIVREPDSGSVLYNVLEVYKNGKTRLIGKSINIEVPKYEGQCRTFYANGQKKNVVSYKNGIKTGDYYEFYPNGKFYMQATFADNAPLDAAFKHDYLIENSKDSLGNAQVTDGNGYFKGYNSEFTYIEEEGPVKNGNRDGTWKGEFKDINTSFTEVYDNGKLISGTAVFKDGTSSKYSEKRKVPPGFKGGNEAFGRYLSNNIVYPTYARAHDIQGTVLISFVVEKNGALTDVKVMKPVNELLDNEAVRVLRKSPKWVAGTQFGNPIRVEYTVPVSFALQ